eukprot:gnl/TRDRNA2_/TRDRNA2_170181_c3_seq3.p1 gnl/TRDRNA2_/TRDRNA2_170181_c3~~gnl/TRDRNA2_/TRDRNA2_170181_c3_seq3.p1  ORF type:complete len:349 (-),score=46.27 gnl/TRDRNA2_/TRDRNA2_170181_c3_seq3:34-990(-)
MARMARILRTIRIARVMRSVAALRGILLSVVEAMRPLCWALTLLVMIMYVVAVVITQSALLDLTRDLSHSNEQSELRIFWGSLPRSMLTLFQVITEGVEWADVIGPLANISPLLVCVFLMYIGVVYFVVLNVITGVVCNIAIQQASQDPDTVVQNLISSRKAYVSKLVHLFRAMDIDASGGVTIHEMEQLIKGEKMHAWLEAMDLDPDDAWEFFRLLDTDEGNTVDLGEFVTGCLKLRGMAKGIDLAVLMAETRWMRKRLSRFMNYVEQQFGELQPSAQDSVYLKDQEGPAPDIEMRHFGAQQLLENWGCGTASSEMG